MPVPIKRVSAVLVLCSITPIFTLSSVSGESLDLLKVFLNILPPLSNSKEQEELMQQLTEFQVQLILFLSYYYISIEYDFVKATIKYKYTENMCYIR